MVSPYWTIQNGRPSKTDFLLISQWKSQSCKQIHFFGFFFILPQGIWIWYFYSSTNRNSHIWKSNIADSKNWNILILTLQNVYQLQMTQLGQQAMYSYKNETYHTLRFSSYYEVCFQQNQSHSFQVILSSIFAKIYIIKLTIIFSP